MFACSCLPLPIYYASRFASLQGKVTDILKMKNILSNQRPLVNHLKLHPALPGKYSSLSFPIILLVFVCLVLALPCNG